MSEESVLELPEHQAAVSGKPQGCTLAMKLALLEIIAAKKYRSQPNYRSVALRHGLKPASLRTKYHLWMKGKVTLGEPETPEEKEIEGTIQNAKSLDLMRKTEIFLNDLHECELYRAQQDSAAGNNPSAIARMKEVLSLKTQLTRVYESLERRHLAVVDAVRRERERIEQEKIVAARAVEVTSVKVASADATDEEKLKKALKE